MEGDKPASAPSGTASPGGASGAASSGQSDVARLARRRAAREGQGAAAGAADAGSQQSALARLQRRSELRAASRPPQRIEQRLTVISRQGTPAIETRTEYVLPGAVAKKNSYAIYIAFFLCVIVPTILAAIYYGYIASNQYVAEFRFSVQDAVSGSSSTTSALSGLAALTGSASSSSTTNYIVVDYLKSREAAEELQKRINIISLYSKPGIDWWNRFDASKPMEKFATYWDGKVSATFDQVTGIASASIRAFSPQDALLISQTLVKLSEELVNRIANRSATDAVRFAQREVERAEERLKSDRAKLAAYRSRVGVIDPTTSVSASNATLVQNQRATLSQLETQLDALTRQNLSPNAPVVMSLKNQIKATKEQLARTEADVGRGLNGTALSKIVGEYEQLNLEIQFASAAVTSTRQALDQARANAANQHLYITPYVQPSLPESSTYPNRFTSTLTVGLLAFGAWLIGLLLVRSIRERFN